MSSLFKEENYSTILLIKPAELFSDLLLNSQTDDYILNLWVFPPQNFSYYIE